MQVDLLPLTEDQVAAVLPMVAACHASEGVDSSPAGRERALRTLLAHPEFGGIWLIRCAGELAGYIALCRSFSIEFNGFDAFIDELFLTEAFRGRGIGGRVLELIRDEARRRDIGALHLEVARDNAPARRLYASAGFEAREKYLLMSARI